VAESIFKANSQPMQPTPAPTHQTVKAQNNHTKKLNPETNPKTYT